jgi:hypothetical protein
MNLRRILSLMALTLLMAVAITLPSGLTHAATFTVTNTNPTGAGSLRAAVDDAELAAGADVIVFQPGLTGTIDVGDPGLILTSELTIDGAGATISLTNSGDANIFRVNPGADLTLRNFTIANAAGLEPTIIVLDGILNAENMTFSDNIGDGAIINYGITTISGSTFTNNAADIGGAIYNSDDGILTISGSTFTNNRADINFASGGAILNNSTNTATITGSTFTGNQAGNNGGAISNGGLMIISASTFTGNTAPTGSAVAQPNYGFPLNTVISGSSITGNANVAVEWLDGPDVDARGNYWGAADGPSGVGPGSGDAISINVLFDPFLPSLTPPVTPPGQPVTPGASIPLIASDDRINPGQGDTYAVVYVRRDGAGRPAIHIYCVNRESRGYLGLVVTEADLEGIDLTPEQNTLISESDFCNVAFYVLTSGEYQINIGPNPSGDVRILIFRGLSAASLRFSGYNMFEID